MGSWLVTGRSLEAWTNWRMPQERLADERGSCRWDVERDSKRPTDLTTSPPGTLHTLMMLNWPLARPVSRTSNLQRPMWWGVGDLWGREILMGLLTEKWPPPEPLSPSTACLHTLYWPGSCGPQPPQAALTTPPLIPDPLVFASHARVNFCWSVWLK